jgi:hypothetical protein
MKCSLLDEVTLKDGQTLTKCTQEHQGSHQEGLTPKPKRRLEIVLSGDSNMWKQVKLLKKENFLGLTPSLSYLKNSGGINNAEVIASIKKSVSSRLERDALQDIPTAII